jgi:multiple sugar transport system ATP-binding protein
VDGAGLQTVRTEGENSFQPGDQVWLTPDPSRIYRFDRTGLAL